MRAGEGHVDRGEVQLDDEFRNRYALGRVLGIGGCGTVYEAVERAGGRRVAIKFLTRLDSPQILKRFLREGRILRDIRHPNILQVFDVHEIGGHPYLVCELLEGGSVSALLSQRQVLDAAEAGKIMRDILAGLHEIHERGIVHRDLKPANVLLDENACAKVADLGIAKEYGAGDVSETMPGTILGSPCYMAPEQVRGDPVCVSTDIYSAGVIFYQMLAGEPPVSSSRWIDIIRYHQSGHPRPLTSLAPDVSPPLAALVHEALSREPGGRPRSARDFADRIARLVPPPERIPRPAGQRRPGRARSPAAPVMGATLVEKPPPHSGARAAPPVAALPSFAPQVTPAASFAPGLPAQDGAVWRTAVAIGLAVGLAVLGLLAVRMAGRPPRPSPSPTAPAEPPESPAPSSPPAVASPVPTPSPSPPRRAQPTASIPVPQASPAGLTTPAPVAPPVAAGPLMNPVRLRLVRRIPPPADRSTAGSIRCVDPAAPPVQVSILGRQVAVFEASGHGRVFGCWSRSGPTLTMQRRLPRDLAAVLPDTWQSLVRRPAGTGTEFSLVDGATTSWRQTWDHPVSVLALSPDGRQFVSGSTDGTVAMWDLQSGVQLWTDAVHTRPVAVAVFSGNGERVFTGEGAAGASARPLSATRPVTPPRGAPLSLARGLSRAAPGDAPVGLVRDASNGQTVWSFGGPAGGFTAAAMTRKGESLAVAGAEPRLTLLDVQRRVVQDTAADAPDGVTVVVFTPDDAHLLVGTAGGTLVGWYAGNLVRSFSTETGLGTLTHLVADRKFSVAVVGSKPEVRVFGYMSGKEWGDSPHGSCDPLRWVELVPDGSYAVTVSEGGLVTRWDLATGRVRWQVRQWKLGKPLAAAIVRDTGAVLVVEEWGLVELGPDGAETASHASTSPLEGDGAAVVGRTLFWTGRPFDLTAAARAPESLASSSGGPAFLGVVPGRGRALYLTTPLEITVVDTAGSVISRVTLQLATDPRSRHVSAAPDGRVLAVAGAVPIAIHDLDDGRQTAVTESADFDSLALLPDGRTVVGIPRLYGPGHAEVVLLDTVSGRRLSALTGHDVLPNGPIRVTPDGRTALVGATDGSVLVIAIEG